MHNICHLCIDTIQIKGFHLFSCPFGFAQEFQAGADTWVVVKTIDAHTAVHFFPAKVGYKVFQHHLQGDAMQGIILLGLGHAVKITIIVVKSVCSPRQTQNSRVAPLGHCILSLRECYRPFAPLGQLPDNTWEQH